MSEILLFAPFRKSIVDQIDDSLSLIELMHFVVMPHMDSQPLPSDAVRDDFTWSVVSVWKCEPGDDDKKFQQRFQIILPDGQVNAESIMDFQVGKLPYRIRLRANGFPVGKPGECWLVLSLRELGHQEWKEMAPYPIEVMHSGSSPFDTQE